MRQTVALLPLILSIACSTKAEVGTVAGELRLPQDARAKSFSVYIDTDSNQGNGVVKSIEGKAGAGDRIVFEAKDIKVGSYFVYALVDVTGDGSTNADIGDFIGFADGGDQAPAAASISVTKGATTKAVVFMSVVSSEAFPDVSGTLTLPQAIANKDYIVLVDDNADPDDGFADAEMGVTGDDATVPYTIRNVPPGNDYFLYAIVDVDGDGEVSLGDFMGFYRGSDGAPPDDVTLSGLDLAGPTRADSSDADIALAPVDSSLDVTVTLPPEANGKAYTLFIDDDASSLNGAIRVKKGTVDGETLSLSEAEVPAGTEDSPKKYYVYIDVDTDESDSVTPGDYRGYAGGKDTTTGSGSSARVTMSPSANTQANISAAVVKNVLSMTATAPAADFSASRLVIDRDQNPLEVEYKVFNGGRIKGEPVFAMLETNVPAGEYNVFAYAYRASGSEPVVGDYFGNAGSALTLTTAPQVTMTADGVKEVAVTLGTVTNGVKAYYGRASSTPDDPTKVTLVLDDDGDFSNGFVAAKTGTYDELNRSYYFANVQAGMFFLYAWIDVDGDNTVNTGDLLGYYGGTDAASPAEANVDVKSDEVATYTNSTPLGVVP